MRHSSQVWQWLDFLGKIKIILLRIATSEIASFVIQCVGSLKTSLDKTCQPQLFIADEYTPYLGQPSRGFRSRTKQHKRAVNELSNGLAPYGL